MERRIFNNAVALKPDEEILWKQSLSPKQAFMFFFKVVIWVIASFMLIGLILAITKVANWYIVLFFGAMSIFAMIIASVAFIRGTGSTIIYYLTNYRLIKISGVIVYISNFKDIKKIKKCKSWFNKSHGTIKIFINKKISINYHLNEVSDIDTAYNLIESEIAKSKKNS